MDRTTLQLHRVSTLGEKASKRKEMFAIHRGNVYELQCKAMGGRF